MISPFYATRQFHKVESTIYIKKVLRCNSAKRSSGHEHKPAETPCFIAIFFIQHRQKTINPTAGSCDKFSLAEGLAKVHMQIENSFLLMLLDGFNIASDSYNN